MKKIYLLSFMVMLSYIGASASEGNPLNPHSTRVETGLFELKSSAFVGITGQVTDENGEAFPGVNIVVKGTATGTTSDVSGRYSLEVPDANSILIFSFVGYASQEIPIGGRTVIDITLNPDIQSLQEVVVTAL